jgi:2-C-methyl-D-erythritol 4-phosphate cytidylyltransferase
VRSPRGLTVAAILVAAGSGRRLGADVPKAFCLVAGRSLLEHAGDRFGVHPDVRDIVVVAPDAFARTAAAMLPAAAVVAGGRTRQESVRYGLAALASDIDTVLVHDVARPFVPPQVITRVVAALAAGADAVIPVLVLSDTVKTVDAAGRVTATIDRGALRAVQTPQGFRREVLAAAHAHGAGRDAPDDAALVEALGRTVVVVDGADESFKITRPWDLLTAEAVAPR